MGLDVSSSVRLHALPFILLVAACAGRSAPPPLDLPAPNAASFLPAVRAQVESAYARAAGSPGDAEAVGRYGMVLDAYSQYDAARACYQRAHRLDPASFRWAYYLALLQEGRGDRAAAIATLRDALKLAPEYAPARIALSSMLRDSGEAEQARALAESAVRDAPGSAPARYALGRALAAMGQGAAAVPHLEEAVRIAPRYAAAHYALALAHRDLGHAEAGAREMALYEKNRHHDPPADDPLVDEIQRLNSGSLVHLRQADQLYQEKRFPEAAAAYESALAVQGEDKTIHTALVATYSQMKDWPKAEAHYRAAVAVDPAFAKAHFNMALVRAQQGDFRAAEELLRRALAADPDDAPARVQLAQVYEAMNQPAKAALEYRTALQKDPRAQQTRALLVRRLLADGRGREALDELLQLLAARDIRPEDAQRAVRQTYPKVGTPAQVARYLKDARRRAAARGDADLVATIDTELAALKR
jgi:tetratricopeptide (TPR) repeat protein